MKAEEAEEYTAGLEQIGSGLWRQILWADRQGIPKAMGLTTPEWVEQRIGAYPRLAVEERREAARELVEAGLTQREAADVLGVGVATVNRDVSNGTGKQSDQDERGESVPNETPTPAQEKRALAKRVAALPDDLAESVHTETMTIDEAEKTAHRRAERIRVLSEKVVGSLRTLGRMANYPVPKELAASLSSKELKVLRRVLDALEGDDYGFLG